MADLLPPCGLVLLLAFLLLLIHPILGFDGGDSPRMAAEEFSEELLLRPLPDRKLLAQFHFRSSAPSSAALGRHHHLFPKSIAQLVQKFRVKELELSFTQGRWNYERWGSDPISGSNVKPPGVELWSIFDLPSAGIDPTWKNLTHALSGLFCSSINFLESSTAYSKPVWGFPVNSSNLRYGALPREAVCTENLTPWLKLLPCRDKSGLAFLLDRPSIYKAHYHSQRLRIVSATLSGIVLDQTLTVVLQPHSIRNNLVYSSDVPIQPSWSVNSVFRNKVAGKCALAKHSKLFVELEKNLVAALEDKGSNYSLSNPVFELFPTPDKVQQDKSSVEDQTTSVLYEFDINKYDDQVPLDVGITWKLPILWSSSYAPFHASRFLMGSGNERGSIAISFQSTTRLHEWLLNSQENCTFPTVVFQVVPWYVKVYYHTIQIFVDGRPQATPDMIKKMKISPSEDKKSPGVLEMILDFPCSMHSASMMLDYDKGFLHIDEYPPDANQGFDIPSAVISFPELYSSRKYLGENSLNQSPILFKFQERNIFVSYTEVLLVPLTTPDFSMPYNVITFTCTVLALYFGSLLNVLRRRIGEEERLSNSKDPGQKGLISRLLSSLSSKRTSQLHEEPSASPPLLGAKLLIKIVFVAGLAVVWQYYFNDR